MISFPCTSKIQLSRERFTSTKIAFHESAKRNPPDRVSCWILYSVTVLEILFNAFTRIINSPSAACPELRESLTHKSRL